MRTRDVHDDEWVRPVMQNYIMECCGCGRLYAMDFRVSSDDGGIEMRGRRIGPNEAALLRERMSK